MRETALQISSPGEIATELARRVRASRLQLNWKQSTLAEHSGVSLATLKRYEQTGQGSVATLLALCHALGRLDEFLPLLKPIAAESMAELEARTKRPTRKRGAR